MTNILGENTDRAGFRSTIIYIMVWFLIMFFPIVNEMVETGYDFHVNWRHIIAWWKGAVIYLGVFLIHNYLLINKLFLKKKQTVYTITTVLIVILFSIYEYYIFKSNEAIRIQEAILMQRPLPPLPPNPSLIPRPVTTKIILLLFMLATNLSIAIRNKYYKEQRRLNELEAMRLLDELKYLKTQVNPHFFMNMLNNIHAMVEVDASKAQDMIVELSKLMRYVLYEGNTQSVSLENEIKFIRSYIMLMRQRYPQDKVKIDLKLPGQPDKDIMLPPLLLITFLENAFKHGISYRNETLIRIQLDQQEEKIILQCYNTKPEHPNKPQSKGGMGLANTRRRLDLLFGNAYTLECNETPNEYNVKLIIPCQK